MAISFFISLTKGIEGYQLFMQNIRVENGTKNRRIIIIASRLQGKRHERLDYEALRCRLVLIRYKIDRHKVSRVKASPSKGKARFPELKLSV